MAINKLFSLKDKVAIVTGGAGHLGAAISESLAEAGAKVVVAGRNLEKAVKKADELSKKYNTECMGLVMDISSLSSVKNAMKEIKKKMKKIDLLVNNAYFSGSGRIESMSEKEWAKGIDGTVSGVFRCSQAVIPYMAKAGGGAIINIASMYGMVSPDPSIYDNTGFNNPPNYGAGKAAIIQFTRFEACHLADKNIRVNSISPGAFPDKKVQSDKKFISKLKKKIPARRIGEPNDIKGAVLFLASEASSYVTGVNLIVDGGWTAW
ncbi:SDR family oxidoreductase [Candidatus Omnitrophota bacterium]